MAEQADMHAHSEPAQPVPDVTTLMGHLTEAMSRMSAMETQLNSREAEFQAHVARQQAEAAAREAAYRNQIESLQTALRSANDAGWINSVPAASPYAPSLACIVPCTDALAATQRMHLP